MIKTEMLGIFGQWHARQEDTERLAYRFSRGKYATQDDLQDALRLRLVKWTCWNTETVV